MIEVFVKKKLVRVHRFRPDGNLRTESFENCVVNTFEHCVEIYKTEGEKPTIIMSLPRQLTAVYYA
jgi:hypothetical protein